MQLYTRIIIAVFAVSMLYLETQGASVSPRLTDVLEDKYFSHDAADKIVTDAASPSSHSRRKRHNDGILTSMYSKYMGRKGARAFADLAKGNDAVQSPLSKCIRRRLGKRSFVKKRIYRLTIVRCMRQELM